MAARVVSIPHAGLQSATEDKAATSLDVDVAIGVKEILQREEGERKIAEHRKSQGLDRICDECGDEIEAKRLEAKPFAIRCCTCQELKEEADRLNGKAYPLRAF